MITKGRQKFSYYFCFACLLLVPLSHSSYGYDEMKRKLKIKTTSPTHAMLRDGLPAQVWSIPEASARPSRSCNGHHPRISAGPVYRRLAPAGRRQWKLETRKAPQRRRPSEVCLGRAINGLQNPRASVVCMGSSGGWCDRHLARHTARARHRK